jgi:hypothetical protein
LRTANFSRIFGHCWRWHRHCVLTTLFRTRLWNQASALILRRRFRSSPCSYSNSAVTFLMTSDFRWVC